ncbi:hypothetical protein CBM2637_A120197 [Cupriavidus taiwanensis]|nr:hypothetical protein CBM2637_A120197 [Cupriavidus taiwanensis]
MAASLSWAGRYERTSGQFATDLRDAVHGLSRLRRSRRPLHHLPPGPQHDHSHQPACRRCPPGRATCSATASGTACACRRRLHHRPDRGLAGRAAAADRRGPCHLRAACRPARHDLRLRFTDGRHAADGGHAGAAATAAAAACDRGLCRRQRRDGLVRQLCPDDGCALSCGGLGRPAVGAAGRLCRAHGSRSHEGPRHCRRHGWHTPGLVAGCAIRDLPRCHHGLAGMLRHHQRDDVGPDCLGAGQRAGFCRSACRPAAAAPARVHAAGGTSRAVRDAQLRAGAQRPLHLYRAVPARGKRRGTAGSCPVRVRRGLARRHLDHRRADRQVAAAADAGQYAAVRAVSVGACGRGRAPCGGLCRGGYLGPGLRRRLYAVPDGAGGDRRQIRGRGAVDAGHGLEHRHRRRRCHRGAAARWLRHRRIPGRAGGPARGSMADGLVGAQAWLPVAPLNCWAAALAGRCLQPRQLVLVEARGAARLEVEGPAQLRRAVLFGQPRVGGYGIQSALRAQPAVPMVADGDVADLVAQDDVDDGRGGMVAGAGQPRAHRRRRVEPARLERARHQRHARQYVAGGLVGHLPQAVVGREIAVGGAERGEMVGQQREVVRLFIGHAQPVAVIRGRHAGKAPGRVQRQVDGIELDMAQRVDHRRASGRGLQRAAPLDVLGRHQGRPCRSARDRVGGPGMDRLARFQGGIGQRHHMAIKCARRHGLVARIRQAQHRQSLPAWRRRRVRRRGVGCFFWHGRKIRVCRHCRAWPAPAAAPPVQHGAAPFPGTGPLKSGGNPHFNKRPFVQETSWRFTSSATSSPVSTAMPTWPPKPPSSAT